MSLSSNKLLEQKPPSPFHSRFKKQKSIIFIKKKKQKSNYAVVLRRRIGRARRIQRRLKEMRDIRLETELTKAIKLYRENSCIMRENRKLRERALELLEENKILLSHLKLTAQNSPHIPS